MTAEIPATPPRRAAVLGSPIAHSKSPLLHRAAFEALGLHGWTYDRIETTAETLPEVVGGADDAFIGFSVTMPAKTAALNFADERTDRADLIGSANTLIRTERGWRADCTDVDGMTGALAEGGYAVGTGRAILIGAGGTALPSVAALAAAGVRELTVVARSAERAASVTALAARLGMTAEIIAFTAVDELRRRIADADVTVSTVPAPAAEALGPAVSGSRLLVDVIYDPWPTPLATAVEAAGGTVVGGLVMLLHQAFSQAEQFTGRPAPRAAMAAAVV